MDLVVILMLPQYDLFHTVVHLLMGALQCMSYLRTAQILQKKANHTYQHIEGSD